MRPAAFFDLDRTLIDRNSGFMFARFEYEAGRISRTQLARAFGWHVAYHLNVIDMQAAYDAAVAHDVGTPARRIDDRTRTWFDREVAPRLLPDARRAMDARRAEGLPLVILSNTSAFQAKVAMERWGFDDWLANEFEVDADDRLTGRLIPPLAYGPGKVLLAERWAAEHDVDLGASWFYSDSLSDVPMLAAVGHPVVVNPDPRLTREARRRGWPVERWLPDA